MTSVSGLGQTHHTHRKHATSVDDESQQAANQTGAASGTKKSSSVAMMAIVEIADDGTSDTSSASSTSTDSTDALSRFSDLLSKLMMAIQNATDTSASGDDAGSGDRHGPPSAAEIAKKLDTNNDGKIDKDEFVAGRPKNVSEEQAAEKFAAIDTTNKGTITADDIEADMKAHKPGDMPPPPPPPPGPENASTTDQSGETSADAILKQILAAIESYRQHASDSSTETNTAV